MTYKERVLSEIEKAVEKGDLKTAARLHVETENIDFDEFIHAVDEGNRRKRYNEK